jgi:hypothetical protein
MARQGKARQGKRRQCKARQGKARQGKAMQGKAREGMEEKRRVGEGKATTNVVAKDPHIFWHGTKRRSMN